MDRNRIALIVIISVVAVTIIAVAIAVPVSRNNRETTPDSLQRAQELMMETPLIDGHNDLPWQLKNRANNRLEDPLNNLNEDLTGKFSPSHTDIPRLKAGKVGAQFWAAYTSCSSQYMDSIRHIIDQIDVIKRMCEKYDEFEFVDSSEGIRDAFKRGKIGSLIGVEGGHNIDSHMAVLRALYALGTRYMTVTHSCNTPWADNWLMDELPENEREFNGLTDFGKNVIREMNRLGMIIDLSHVSVEVMKQVLSISAAPVMFSHSSAYAICANYRNVNDEVLKIVKEKEGVVMVNFYTKYINCPPYQLPGTTENNGTLSQVANHLDHIKSVCGEDCVGLGSDFDGVSTVPDGLEDVSKFPYLIAELIDRGWSDTAIKKLLGENLLRVFKGVEDTRDSLQSKLPDESSMPRNSGKEVNNTCRTYVFNPDEA
ncbi:dipeptidase 1-like [Anneissia japonica]|uniref:dipeptidase 1-like n=1 Tax=Anneissia japonica TaxID=1529436 RepID=UPI0014257E83|nr:dipeptidase 1-like [Anneissia japonica]